jgi:hypothetical protein
LQTSPRLNCQPLLKPLTVIPLECVDVAVVKHGQKHVAAALIAGTYDGLDDAVKHPLDAAVDTISVFDDVVRPRPWNKKLSRVGPDACV